MPGAASRWLFLSFNLHKVIQLLLTAELEKKCIAPTTQKCLLTTCSIPPVKLRALKQEQAACSGRAACKRVWPSPCSTASSTQSLQSLHRGGSGSGDPQAGRGAGTGCAAQEVGGRARAWAEELGSAGFSSEREQGTSIHEICVNRT